MHVCVCMMLLSLFLRTPPSQMVCVFLNVYMTTGAGSGFLLHDRWTCHLVLPVYMFPSLLLSLSPAFFSIIHTHEPKHIQKMELNRTTLRL